MPNEQVVNPDQTSAFESPWSYGQRALRALWEFCSFVHSRARIAIPWKLILHDRACLGDRADAFLLGEIELGQRATVAPEVNLSAGSDDSSQPGMPLTPTAKITVGADAFIGAGSVVTEDVPSHVFAPGNPSRIFRPR